MHRTKLAPLLADPSLRLTSGALSSSPARALGITCTSSAPEPPTWTSSHTNRAFGGGFGTCSGVPESPEDARATHGPAPAVQHSSTTTPFPPAHAALHARRRHDWPIPLGSYHARSFAASGRDPEAAARPAAPREKAPTTASDSAPGTAAPPQPTTQAGALVELFKREAMMPPNLVSLARLVTAPFIAYLIMDDQWQAALVATAVSGWSDWLDGYLARRLGQESVLGTYLDPLGDKALICCVAGALGAKGLLPMPLAIVIVGKDALLVVGTLAMAAFGSGNFGLGGPAAASGGAAGVASLPVVRPAYISKVNTVFQIGLVGLCLSQAALGWPEDAVVYGAGAVTAVTTVWSTLIYVRKPAFVKTG